MTSSPAHDLQTFLSDLLGGASLDVGQLTGQARNLGKRGEDLLIDKLGMEDSDASRAQIRQQAKYAGMAAGLALLLKSRSARKLATLGGLAALGTIAYRGHKRGDMPDNFRDAIGLLTGKAAQERSEILLDAMIAAARADGHISDEEAILIEAYPGADKDDLEALVAKPPNPERIAGLADTEQTAAEIYAVSARIANGLNPAERDYLDRLAMALKLDPEAAAQIETDVRVGP